MTRCIYCSRRGEGSVKAVLRSLRTRIRCIPPLWTGNALGNTAREKGQRIATVLAEASGTFESISHSSFGGSLTLCLLFYWGDRLLVFFKYPIVGVLIEGVGFMGLFGYGVFRFLFISAVILLLGTDAVGEHSDFFPVILNFLRQLPVVGTFLSLPYIRSVSHTAPFLCVFFVFVSDMVAHFLVCCDDVAGGG